MKKIIFISMFIIVILLLNNKQYNVSKDSIRFRVIANSNMPRDIIMKERVVDELSSILFVNNNEIDDTRDYIYSNLGNIENRINNLFEKYNYKMNFKVSYGINEFPEKEFLGNIYPSGEYESLVIDIGNSEGNNYFSILYPSLCMIDYENKKNNKEYGFKLVELFDKLF